MIFPKKLQAGDLIALTAPSSPITTEEAERCAAFIESLGYRVASGASLTSVLHGYEAGGGRARAEELNAMFRNHEVSAIFCVRGGDSSSHAVEFIDCDAVRANPKIFVGYSDITNYHTLFNRAGLITFHGPMVKTDMIGGFDNYSSEAFWKILGMGERAELENPPASEIKTARPGTACGRLTGGNLALVTSMLGTPYQIEAAGKILFIEDVNENVARLDRMLHQLKFAGKFAEAGGVIAGAFTDCQNSRDPGYGVEELLLDFFSDYDKPVLYNVQAGHCSPAATLPMGALCEINGENRSIILYGR